MAQKLPYTLERVIWRYLTDEERYFLGRWWFPGTERRIAEDKKVPIQQIANFAAREGWDDAVVQLYTCINLNVVFAHAVSRGHIGLADVIENLGGGKNYTLAAELAAKESNINGLARVLVWNQNGPADIDSALCAAAAAGDEKKHLDVISYLKEQGATLQGASHPSGCALVFAAEANNVNIVKYFLDNYGHWDIQDEDCYEAILGAARAGSIPIIKLLCENKRDDIDFSLKIDITQWATQGGQLDVIKFLFKSGHSLSLREDDHHRILNSAFEYAAEFNHTHIMKWVKNESKGRLSDLHLEIAVGSAVRGDAIAAFNLMIEWKYVHLSERLLDGLLWSAADAGASKIIPLLIQMGAREIDEAFIQGAIGANLRVIETLKELGATAFQAALEAFTAYTGQRAFNDPKDKKLEPTVRRLLEKWVRESSQ